MRLWVKTSLIAIAVCAVAMGASAMAILGYTAVSEVDKATHSALNEQYLFCTALVSAVAPRREASLSAVTNRSVAEYYFKNMAGFYQERDIFFSLIRDGEYLYNRSPFDSLALMPPPQDDVRRYAIVQAGDARILMVAGPLTLLDRTYTVYYTEDITPLYRDMRALAWRVTWVGLGCMAALSALLLMMNRLALRPVRSLAAATERMAGGEYAQRVAVTSADEVGQLGMTFNRMAGAVQAHVRQLEETARQRKLLLSSLTHELKTPMTAIIGYSDSMLHFKLGSDRQRQAVRQIYDQCRHMERLSQKLMRLITLDAGEDIAAEPLAVDALLGEVNDTMAATLAQRRQTLAVENRLQMLTADRDLMLSLLGNLIDNAGKASPPESIIRLRAYCDQDGRAVLEVSDGGAGIPPEELPHITEPFYRVEPSRSRRYGGLGLGLSLCQIIARKHGAKLQIENNAAGGACVRVLFGGVYSR